MEFRHLYGSKGYFLLIAVLITGLLGACKPSGETVDDNGEFPSFETDNRTPKTKDGEDSVRTEAPSVSQEIVISYQNQSSNVEVVLDPNRQEFFLDLSGMKPPEKDTVVIADSTLIKKRATDIQKLLSAFRKAQDLFYLGEYNQALLKVNESLRIQETADAYGLKGTIYFMLDNKSATKANWNKAMQLNPDINIPSIPELEEIIEDIKGDTEQ